MIASHTQGQNPLITALSEEHFGPLREVLDFVARERKYLAIVEAPPLDATKVFYQKLVEGGCSHVALLDDQIVGWCDIMRNPGQTTQHIGLLGVGLLPQARRMGIGRLLMEATIHKAWQQGLTRIELNVREDNLNAKALYECLGFQVEGFRRDVFLIDGKYLNCYSMALLNVAAFVQSPPH